MSDPHAPQHYSKHAWHEVDRQSLPRRSVVERVADFLEIYGPYDEATAREQASRCIQCPEPACVKGCPLANRIPDWMLLTAEGRFLEAAALSQTTSNLPEICGRVCPTEVLCEGQCILNDKSEPVSIGALEQFINDYALAHGGMDSFPPPPNGMRVAVCGSGPAGLACADELAGRGYAVTIFESRLLPGGLLVNGIPAFKLEKSVVQRRLDLLKKRGVEFRLGVKVGEDITLRELQNAHDAVFLGFDAQEARTLEVPGGNLAGVVQALPFIIQKNTDFPTEIPAIDVAGKRVVVVGGGDTALDCLRTALRCCAREAICLYRRDEDHMPGSRAEFRNAVEEGARFEFLATPVVVLDDGHGRAAGIRAIRTGLGTPDSRGRRAFHEIKGSEFELAADWILLALGFEGVSFQPGSDFRTVATTESGFIRVDANQMTNVPGVFAGGDTVRGPSLVGQAVRDARKAAIGIHSYLSARNGMPGEPDPAGEPAARR